MSTHFERLRVVAEQQYDVVAIWQLRQRGWSKTEIDAACRGLRRVYRGVRALGDLTDLGWFMAAALAGGPGAMISHLSAVSLMGLCKRTSRDVHVTIPRRAGLTARDGLIPHRPTSVPERWEYRGIPVSSPTQSLRDADLKPWELYRALDIAAKSQIPLSLPLNEVVRLHKRVRGRTKSEAEARFLWLAHEAGFPLPLVNHHLNGFETDFHWPELRLVVEVDGWEHHRERKNFNTDRYRGLVHRAHGWDVVRVSADHVYDLPELVVDALVLGRHAAPTF